MHGPIRLASLVLVAALLLCIPRGGAAQSPAYEKILAERNIASDSASLAEYLRGLHPSPERQAKTKSLIEQLGDANFQAREQAMSGLLAMPAVARAALINATTSQDPEVRWRAKKILDASAPEDTRILYAVFQVIAAQRTPGMLAELLAALPLCDQPHMKVAATQAIVSVARPEDAAQLRTAYGSEHSAVRAAVATALGKVLGKTARDELIQLLQDDDERVQLSAAMALADLGERACLEALVALLNADELQVRDTAADALRQLSGKNFGFAAYQPAEQRAKVIGQWTSWVVEEGKSAELRFPLTRGQRSYLNGNTLLAYGHNHKVVELDPSGKEVWTYQGKSPWRADKLANGNVLIADVLAHHVVQIDPQGEVVWKHELKHPVAAQLLANGNVLIAQYTDSKALEVTPAGKVVWEYAVKNHCTDARRLENGNTLVVSQNESIAEVTPTGQVSWRYETGTCYGCQPLPDGNVLISSMEGRVVEVTRKKEIIWECKHPGATEAFRLANGNTLISGRTSFVEMTPDKEVVWSKEGCKYGSIRR